jgi:predicted O-methyltransferase YrrM
MDDAVKMVLAEYDKRASAEAVLQEDIPMQQFPDRRDEFLLAVGPEAGQLLNILARESKARAILEIGTSYGYSTVWLAEAARETGGRVVTMEKSANKIDYARTMLSRAGLEAHVEFRLGDARDTIASLDGPFDFVLLDLWKDLYIPCFDLLYPNKLSAGAFLAADNMIFPENYQDQARIYRRHVRSKPRIDSVLLPVGHGIELSRFADTLAP